MHTSLNAQAAREAKVGQAPRYISPDEVAWGMHGQGLLPSQQAQTEQVVQRYVQVYGGTPEQAYATLHEQRQLPHQQVPAQPRPQSYASEAEWQAARTTDPNTPS